VWEVLVDLEGLLDLERVLVDSEGVLVEDGPRCVTCRSLTISYANCHKSMEILHLSLFPDSLKLLALLREKEVAHGGEQ
jgi:hypothetical protein